MGQNQEPQLQVRTTLEAEKPQEYGHMGTEEQRAWNSGPLLSFSSFSHVTGVQGPLALSLVTLFP